MTDTKTRRVKIHDDGFVSQNDGGAHMLVTVEWWEEIVSALLLKDAEIERLRVENAAQNSTNHLMGKRIEELEKETESKEHALWRYRKAIHYDEPEPPFCTTDADHHSTPDQVAIAQKRASFYEPFVREAISDVLDALDIKVELDGVDGDDCVRISHAQIDAAWWVATKAGIGSASGMTALHKLGIERCGVCGGEGEITFAMGAKVDPPLPCQDCAKFGGHGWVKNE